MGRAFESGNLKALKLLFAAGPVGYDEGLSRQEFGLKPSMWTIPHASEAARKGYVNCIEFAVAHGCPWYRLVRIRLSPYWGNSPRA